MVEPAIAFHGYDALCMCCYDSERKTQSEERNVAAPDNQDVTDSHDKPASSGASVMKGTGCDKYQC